MGQHSPLPRVYSFVNGAVYADRALGSGKRMIEICFPYVRFGTVDVLQGGAGVERQTIGAVANDIAILLVAAPELQMPIALPSVVGLVKACDSRKEWSWISGERMEV